MDKLNINNNEFVIKDGYLETVFLCDKQIVIPEGVNVIGSLSFDVNYKENEIEKYFDRGLIEEIILPSTLEKIETGAFKHCNLKSIKMPDGLKLIGRGVFATNSNLEEIEMYDSIEEIESYAFATKMHSVNKLFKGHIFDKNYYIIDIPSKFIINYSSFDKLDKLMDLLKNSGSFGSNTYKLKLFKSPKIEFILVGPELNKSETLKIYKKLLLMRCNRVGFVNNNEMIELPGVNEEIVQNEDVIDNSMDTVNIDDFGVNEDIKEDIDNNSLDDNGRGR